MDLPKNRLDEAKKIERLRSLRRKMDLNVDLERSRKDRTAVHAGLLKSAG